MKIVRVTRLEQASYEVVLEVDSIEHRLRFRREEQAGIGVIVHASDTPEVIPNQLISPLAAAVGALVRTQRRARRVRSRRPCRGRWRVVIDGGKSPMTLPAILRTCRTQGPATAEAIEAAEAKLGHRLPDDYKAMLLEGDGIEGFIGNDGRGERSRVECQRDAAGDPAVTWDVP